jgi:hypothetical protein
MYMSSSSIKGVVPFPYTDQSLLLSPSIMNLKYVSTVNPKSLVMMYMSFPIALIGPFNEKEVMEMEKDEGGVEISK